MKRPAFSCYFFFCLCFSAFCQGPVDVTEQTLKIGAFKTGEILLGFAAGDEVIFTFNEANNKEVKEVEIIEWPSTTKFSDYKTTSITEKRFTVYSPSVYLFRFHNSAIGGRVCKLKIQRIPAGEATRNYNTAVTWLSKQDTTWNSYTKDVITGYDTTYQQVKHKELLKTEQREELIMDKPQRVNSTTNVNGNKQWLYFTLPRNERGVDQTSTVVAWAYWVGVGEEAAQAWQKNTQAIKTMVKGAASFYTSPLGALAVGAVLDLATPSLGEDVYYALSDERNKNLLLAGGKFLQFDQGKGPAGYRKFSDKGMCQGTYFITLINDNVMQGINATVKVVAIIETKHLADKTYTEQKITPRFEKKIVREPVINTALVPVAG